MGDAGDRIILYTAQADAVTKVINEEGRCFSREEYVRRKYGESGPIFLTAYGWFVREAGKLVPRPEGEEYPYWAFKDLYAVDRSGGAPVLTLSVPRDQVLFFDVYDWNKILCLKYVGLNEAEEERFHQEMEQCGIREMDAMLSGFHPEWKQRILGSWPRLFRHHEQIKAGDCTGVKSVQAALWQIRKEWIVAD